MNKDDIVDSLAKKTGLSRRKTQEAVNRTIGIIAEEIVKSGRIEFRGFGVFETKMRGSRVARNPRTNEQMILEPRKALVFTPGSDLRELIRDVTENAKEAGT